MAAISVALPVTSWAWSGGPPDGNTNAPGEGVCVACHNSFDLNSGQGSLVLNGLPERYALGETYRLEIVLSDPDASRWGFELTAKDQDRHGAGDFSVVDADHTQISDPGGNSAQYVKQRSAGTYAGQADGATWEVDWTTPDEDIGEIGFYVAGNAANNNGRNSSDFIYATSTALEAEEPPPPPDEYVLHLMAGWNLVSSPVTPGITTLDSLFAGLNAAQTLIIMRDRSGAVYNPVDNIREIINWDYTAAYQIKVADAAEVPFSGAFTDTANQYQLSDGWNWISYPRRDSIFVTEALAPLAGNLLLVKNNDGLLYVPELEFNQLGYIHPGEAWGIEIASDDTVTFVWPEPQDVFDVPEPPVAPQHFFALPNTGRNMHLFITNWGDDVLLGIGDEIGVRYDDGEGMALCGFAVLPEDADSFAITVWGDDDLSDPRDGPRTGNPLEISYWYSAADTEVTLIPVEAPGDSAVEYQNDAFIPVGLYYKAPPNSAPPSSLIPYPSSLLLSVYPNPFNATSAVSYQLSAFSKASLKLYDINGREVRRLAEGWQSAGEHRITFSGDGLATGLYIVSLESGSDRQMKTVVLIR
jgi:hypothetical protein